MEDLATEKVHDVPLSDLDVKMSGVGDGSGRGVFTKVDILKGSTIGRKTYRYPVIFNPSATERMLRYMSISLSFDDMYRYVDGYGWENNMLVSCYPWFSFILHCFNLRSLGQSKFMFFFCGKGDDTYLVDSSILTFVNHGCNATYNFDDVFGIRLRGTRDFVTEQNATEGFTVTQKVLLLLMIYMIRSQIVTMGGIVRWVSLFGILRLETRSYVITFFMLIAKKNGGWRSTHSRISAKGRSLVS